jgi:RimJ/RimL family protein N-acetyltransferase
VLLRGWREDDIPALLKLRNDWDLQEQLMTQPRPNSDDTVRQWLARRSAGPENVFFVVADVPTNEVAGYLQYTNIDTLNGTGDFGICIAPAFHGRGHAPAAMNLAERYLKEVFNARKVVLRVFADNARAIRLYEKQGFQKCGLLRRQFLREGVFQDVVIMEKFLDAAVR